MAVKMMFFGRSRSLRWVFGRDLTSGLALGRALRGKECIVKGVRDGSEVREDRTRLLVQEIEKMAEKQKSFIAPK
jgi:hypothetical protein